MTQHGPYAKDPGEEAFLVRLNETLQEFEQSGYSDRGNAFPTVQVIGVPRSGTTLATQLLATHLEVGYIDHLIAAFWKAPTVGIRLSRKLLRAPDRSSFTSVYGRTSSIREPHEFGYFWCDLLGYEDLSDLGPFHEKRIDWARVSAVLNNMTRTFDCPIVFKSFWLSMHVARTLEALPRTCFVRIRRDPLDNALSILQMREQVHGSIEAWASMKPREYPQLSGLAPHAQVAGQVFYLQRMMSAQLAQAPAANVLDVRYEDMCARPDEYVRDVREMLAGQGCRPALRGDGVADRFETHQRQKVADPGDVEALQKAFGVLAGGAPESRSP